MQIDVTKLKTYQVSKIHFNEKVDLTNNPVDDYRISEVKDVYVDGDVTINEQQELELLATLKGTMILKDDVTFEPVQYNFETEIEEIINDNSFIIDISDILWQNILTEIPSKIRKDDDDIELYGDGWRVISEEKYNEEKNKQNNPFANLDELLKTKEDK